MKKETKMRVTVRLVAAACLVGALAAGTAAMSPAATRTTAPGATTYIPILLTATTIKVKPDIYTLPDSPNVARYPRGAIIIFIVHNHGKQPLSLVLRLMSKLKIYGVNKLGKSESTGNIAPGTRRFLRAQFSLRGSYEFELVHHGKIVAKNPVVVF